MLKYIDNIAVRLLVITLLLCISIDAQSSIFSDCYKADDFGYEAKNIYTVRPVGEECHTYCARKCEIFSMKASGIELNQDIVESCMLSCQSGNPYSSNRREFSSSSKKGYNWSTVIFNTYDGCNLLPGSYNSPYKTEIDTKMVAKPGDKYTFRLTSPNSPGESGSNAVFLCGFSTTSIDPSFDSVKINDWDKNPSSWSTCSSKTTRWNARNKCLVDTGINVKDGDYLNITYGGQFFVKDNNSYREEKDLRMSIPRNAITESLPSSFYKIPGSSVLFPQYNPNTGQIVGKSGGEIREANFNNQFLGLRSNGYRVPTKYYNPEDFANNSSPNPNADVKSFDKFYEFKGFLSGYSDSYTRLALGMNTNNDQGLGGYAVTIIRRGCMFQNGDMLQYAIARKINSESSIRKTEKFAQVTDADFIDFESKHIKLGEPIDIPYEGKIYLRIKPYKYDSSLAPRCNTLTNPNCINMVQNEVPSLYEEYSKMGQYYVMVQKDSKSTDAIVTIIATKLFNYLHGSDDKPGIVQLIYKKIISESILVDLIRAVLVLYISITGILFIIGASPINQKEGITRLLKLSLVAAIIAPQSWEFFNDFFFRFFTDGITELLVLMTVSPETTPYEVNELLKNPLKVFNIFDEPIRILFGKITWLKILAIIFSSPLGIILAIIVALSGLMYIFCITKAAILFLISMVALSVLILLTPIFLCFMLFGATKDMFQSWLKQMLSFMLQPLFVYAFIIHLNTLAFATLKMVLGFFNL